MTVWTCPNKAKIPDHGNKILFEGEQSVLPASEVPYLQVPKPAYCEICDRYYTRAECVEVRS